MRHLTLEDIKRLAGLSEADYKVKDKTDVDWDTFFDEPDAKPVAKVEPKADKRGPEQEKTLNKAGAERTRAATANITPTDAMRDMLSKLDRSQIPDTDGEVPEPVTTQNLPAVINTAIARAPGNAVAAHGRVAPDWHAVSDLPGNMDRAIMRLGKVLFGAFTRTPTKDIVMIGSLGGQGPNSELEVRSVANWVVENGRKVDVAEIDFSQVMPGYKAQIQQYTAAGIRFEMVKDFAGTYIYAWPESDSLDSQAQVSGHSDDQKRLREGQVIARKMIAEGQVTGFRPPFTVSGNWVNDARGRGVCEMGESRAALQDIADALNAWVKQGMAEGADGFKQAHDQEVQNQIEQHGKPVAHKYKHDTMSGRHGAHNSHLHYPDKKVTVNTQMFKHGPAHNVFVTNKDGVVEAGMMDRVKGFFGGAPKRDERGLQIIGALEDHEIKRAMDEMYDMSMESEDWPFAPGDLDPFKADIIRYILTDMKEGDSRWLTGTVIEEILYLATWLIKGGCNWPELKTIKQSAEAQVKAELG